MIDEERNALSILVKAFYYYQNERIALDGRLGVKKDGTRKKKTPDRDEYMIALLLKRRDECFTMGKALEKEIAEKVHKTPLWEKFLAEVKGCGEIISAVIMSQIDIRIAETVSNIWSFAGLAPGKDKKVKKKKSPFNQFLRAKLCGVLGPSFLKCDSPYSQIYYDERHRLESMDWGMASKNPTDKEKPKAWHQHKAANRKMVKKFLQDLYAVWRTIEGLPVREPYSKEYLKKEHHEKVA